jgi:hypothetical protein
MMALNFIRVKTDFWVNDQLHEILKVVADLQEQVS